MTGKAAEINISNNFVSFYFVTTAQAKNHIYWITTFPMRPLLVPEDFAGAQTGVDSHLGVFLQTLTRTGSIVVFQSVKVRLSNLLNTGSIEDPREDWMYVKLGLHYK